MTKPKIPMRAIESAARALLAKEMGGDFDETLHAEDLEACREDARAALEAAWPYIQTDDNSDRSHPDRVAFSCPKEQP